MKIVQSIVKDLHNGTYFDQIICGDLVLKLFDNTKELMWYVELLIKVDLTP